MRAHRGYAGPVTPLRTAAAMLILACAQAASAQPSRADRAITELQDREQIRELLRAYGSTLDRRDFDGFGKLFTDDANYVSGSTTHGGTAIASSLKRIMEENALGFRAPNYHVFFNEVIEVSGDSAHSTSQSFFVVPDAANRPQIALMASYEDELVRDGGAWKFKRRVVRGAFPPAGR